MFCYFVDEFVVMFAYLLTVTKCIAMVEERAKHAVRIFSDFMRTAAGRTAASAVIRRDASLRVTSSSSKYYAEPRADSPTQQDVVRVLMDAGKVQTMPWFRFLHGASNLMCFTICRAQFVLVPTVRWASLECRISPSRACLS